MKNKNHVYAFFTLNDPAHSIRPQDFEEAVKSCNLLAEAMKDDTIDLTRVEISDQARALWTLIRLQNEIRLLFI